MKTSHFDGSVAALHYLPTEELLLAGIGGFVELYDVSNAGDQNFADSIHIFSQTTATIQGFCQDSKDSTRIIVFGGKSLCFLSVKNKRLLIAEKNKVPFTFCDWVLDVNCGRVEDQSGIIVSALSAHNKVIQLNESFHETIIECEDENCILYSGKLVGDKSIVLGGTVFRQVVIWSYSGVNQGRVLHRLKGHEGVIFSVDYSERLSLICSTSDDRSARLWMVDLLPNDHNWSGSKITPLHVLSGQHHSRVFRCHFLSNEATLVTGGEDSFVCLWNCDTGEFKYRRKTHLGSPVWSLADIPDQKRIISGGGDASINSFIADDVSTRPVAACLELENVSEGDYPKLVSFISDTNWIICLTFNGTVKIICSQSGLQATLLQDDQLKNHPFMEVSGDLIFLANLQGYIMVARWTSSTPLPSCTIFHQHQVVCRRQNDQTFAMTYLKKSSNLLLSRANGNMELFDKTSDDRLVSKCIMVLPPCKQQRFFSCAMELGSPPSRIIVGDRCGNIHIYDKDSGVLCQSLNKVHGRHGVGSILSSRSHQNFTTVGRDGLLKTFELDHDQNTIKELSCQRLKINWLERQWSFNDEDYVLGFHSSNFVVHSIHRGTNLVEVDCGGGHRSWDFNGNDLVYIKDKQLMLASTQFGISESFSKSNIRPVCHTREINCICHFELDQKHYLATGGEDTVIKIWAIQDGKKKLVQVLKSHISNVKSIHVFKDHARTYMISAGGRAQLKVWRLAHLQDDNRFCASEAGSHMLKGRDKKRQKCWRDHDLIDDTETRYMSVQGQFQLDNNKVIVIVTACSDGVLRIINFDIATRHFNLVHEGQVQSHAILKVLVHEELGMITANTIGQLTLWDSNCDDKVKQINLVHQSGINVFSLNSNDQLLVSGGDDCALTVSDLNQSLIVARKPDAHAAQVTGVHFLNNDHFVSCSVDQRLSLWKIFNDASEIQHVAQVFSHVPDIQDMAVWRDDHNKTYACLVGNGLEIFIL